MAFVTMIAAMENKMINTGAYVFDAYGTLFDVHAAIARHRAEAGPDAERFSEIWRAKQLPRRPPRHPLEWHPAHA
jgi:HAD superfamily hydrolase (TIGR01493 family)